MYLQAKILNYAYRKLCCMLFWTNPECSSLRNSSCTAANLPSNKLSKRDEQDILGTAGEVWTNSFELLHMDTPVLVDQQKLTLISRAWTLDTVSRTYLEQWPIGKDGEI